jgi:hypothetical protein
MRVPFADCRPDPRALHDPRIQVASQIRNLHPTAIRKARSTWALIIVGGPGIQTHPDPLSTIELRAVALAGDALRCSATNGKSAATNYFISKKMGVGQLPCMD